MNVKQPTGSEFNSNWNGGGMNSASGNISFLMVRDSSLPATRGDNVVLLCTVRRCVPVSGSAAFVIGATFEQILSASTEPDAAVGRIREAILKP